MQSNTIWHNHLNISCLNLVYLFMKVTLTVIGTKQLVLFPF